MKRLAVVVLFSMVQPVYSATIFNSASVSVCVLPGGQIEVTWSASSQVMGDDAETVQSLSLAGEVRSHSTLSECTAHNGVSLGTCSHTFPIPANGVNFCGGQFATSCGISYFSASSVSTSTPLKPSNGKQWSSCTFGDCGAEQCFTAEILMLEKISGLPICY